MKRTLSPGHLQSAVSTCCCVRTQGLPLSGELLELHAPYPKDLETVLRNLRKYR